MQAAGLRLQSLHHAARATHEDRAVQERGLGECRHITGESVCPFQFQARYLILSDPSSWLIARVGRRGAPAIPTSRRLTGQGMSLGTAEGGGRRSRFAPLGARLICDGLALVARERVTQLLYQAECV